MKIIALVIPLLLVGCAAQRTCTYTGPILVAKDLTVVIGAPLPPDAGGKFSIQTRLNVDWIEKVPEDFRFRYEKDTLSSPKVFSGLGEQAHFGICRKYIPLHKVPLKPAPISSPWMGPAWSGTDYDVTVNTFDDASAKGTFAIRYEAGDCDLHWSFALRRQGVPFTANQPVLLQASSKEDTAEQ